MLKSKFDFVEIKESKNLSSMRYDYDTELLYVIFINNSVYKYRGLTSEIFKELKKDKDIGKYFYDNIREKYEYEKLI